MSTTPARPAPARNRTRATLAITVGYAAPYDPEDHLVPELKALLEVLVDDPHPRVRGAVLKHALPRTVAAYVTLCNGRVSADEALRLGIVNRVVPRESLDEVVDALVADIVSRPPLAVQGAKAAVRGGWGASTDDGMRAAAVAQLRCLGSADFIEAGRAFVEGREPSFQGR